MAITQLILNEFDMVTKLFKNYIIHGSILYQGCRVGLKIFDSDSDICVLCNNNLKFNILITKLLVITH